MNDADPLSGLRPPSGGRTPAALDNVMGRGRALRSRRRRVVAGVAAATIALVGLAGFLIVRDGDGNESVVAGPSTTDSVDETSPPPTPPTTAPTTAPPTTEVPVDLGEVLTSARWVVNFDDLRADDGTRLGVTSPALGDATIVRDADAIVFHTGRGLFRWTVGDPRPAEVEPQPPAPDTALRLPDAPITAANGFTAETTGDGAVVVRDLDGGAVLSEVIAGPGAELVRLVDFDGRRLLVARGPVEPAQPRWDHLYVDLVCGPTCTEWFQTPLGTAALVGADDPSVPEVIRTGTPAACATWADEPVALPPDGLPQPVADRFAELSLATARCDRFGLSTGDEPPWGDDAGWNGLADLLRRPVVELDGDWVWAAEGFGSVRIDALGVDAIDLPRRRLSAPISVELSSDGELVLSGLVTPEAENALVAAAEAGGFASVGSSLLTVDPDVITPMVWVDALAELVATGLRGADAASVRLSADGELGIWAVVEGVPPGTYTFIDGAVGGAVELAGLVVEERVDTSLDTTVAEQDAVEELARLAGGGDVDTGVLRFAERVVLAAGPIVVDTVPGAELLDPESWTLELETFRGYDGPFSALDLLADADGGLAIGVGPTARCAGPPDPTPAGLGGLRRLSIRPGSAGDSCLTWWGVDVWLDVDGAIAGISLDRWEP